MIFCQGSSLVPDPEQDPDPLSRVPDLAKSSESLPNYLIFSAIFGRWEMSKACSSGAKLIARR
jgi:hypothetical protein